MKKDTAQTTMVAELDSESTAPREIVSQEEVREYVDELRKDVTTMPKAQLTQSLSLAQGLGMFQAFDLIGQFTGIARQKWLLERKQSGDYKGVTVTDKTGAHHTLKTFEDLCKYIGTSRSKVAEDLQNLTQLGEDFMTTAESLGLGYRDLRLLRKGITALPPEERKAVLDEVASAEGPDELKARLEDLRIELAKVKADKKGLEEDLRAKDRVSKEKSAKLDALEEKLERLSSMDPDDKIKTQNEINAAARKAVDNECHAVFVEVMSLATKCSTIFQDERSTEETCAWIHRRVSVLANTLANTLLDAGIDVDLRAYLELPQEDDDTSADSTANA